MRSQHSVGLKFLLLSAFAASVLPRVQAAEPAKAQPATTQPVKTEPSKNEPAKSEASHPAKGHSLTRGGLKLTVPEGWVSKETNSNYRLMQFSIPKAEGDKDDAQCVAWYFGTNGAGSMNEVAQRWIDQFPPKDRKLKITTGKCPEGDYVVVDISGTWNRPVETPQGGLNIVNTPSGRMLGLILNVRHVGSYFVQLMGTEKTVAANADALRTAIGADAKAEKDYKAPASKATDAKTAADKAPESKSPADKAPVTTAAPKK